MRRLELTEHKFGRLKVLKEIVPKQMPSGRLERQWECICDCGCSFVVLQCNLTSGKTTSCGCYRREMTIARSTTHGRSYSREYHSWSDMWQRCTNRSHKKWHHYGGRGITICDRWKEFELFLEDVGPCPEGYIFDRENNNGNYEPGNCRWTTYETSNRNRRPR